MFRQLWHSWFTVVKLKVIWFRSWTKWLTSVKKMDEQSLSKLTWVRETDSVSTGSDLSSITSEVLEFHGRKHSCYNLLGFDGTFQFIKCVLKFQLNTQSLISTLNLDSFRNVSIILSKNIWKLYASTLTFIVILHCKFKYDTKCRSSVLSSSQFLISSLVISC